MTASRGEVWVHKTSLTVPLIMEVSVPSQESELSSRVFAKHKGIDVAPFIIIKA